jgi:hypothetical protein
MSYYLLPNNALQLTAYSVRFAPASRRSSGQALGVPTVST